MTAPIRFVREIGMFAFSRGRQTCRWPTGWCDRYCYNHKFYCVNPKLDEVDRLDNTFWRGADSEQFVTAAHMASDYKPVPRFRFAVRGEIWTKLDDVEKVYLIMLQMPDTLFWVPTRAWRDDKMRGLIEEMIVPLPNSRALASVDPTTTEQEFKELRGHDWSLVFTGDNENPDQLLLTPDGLREKTACGMHRCEKTWDALRGHCAICEHGCFAAGRVEVHLKKHR